MRCSTNLSGPTEGFGPTDTSIVDALNNEAATVFRGYAPLNHVLAQIYHNTPAMAGRKQSKAKISAHADKTKDMPVGGIMAFCTFYDGLDMLAPMAADPTGLRGALLERRSRSQGRPDLPEASRWLGEAGTVYSRRRRRIARTLRPREQNHVLHRLRRPVPLQHERRRLRCSPNLTSPTK
ncbi:hypothetical protein [Nocardia coubleae]|uniref:hypothetical protein n=1 Tax=Nocardia coubleae TaxID=356147 RepID=UPI000B07E8C2|nr:hypothetical protein [Nocardia coubleae]